MPTILAIQHAYDGGVGQYVRTLAAQCQGVANLLVLRATMDGQGVRLGAPATDADTNAWVDEAYDLIASYAKRYLALHRLKDPALKAAMDTAVQEASTSLKGLATTMTATGVVQSYDL